MHTYHLQQVVLGIMLGAALIFSCKQQVGEPEQPGVPEEALNPDKPNANHLIRTQATGGDSTKSSSIYEMIDAGDGGFYFLGVIDGYRVIGKFDLQGQVVWSRRESVIRAILRIPDATGVLASALVAVGYNTVSADRSEAKVLLVGSDGTRITEEIFQDTTKGMWFNGFTLVSASTSGYEFVAAGGFDYRSDWPYYPYAARFIIGSDGTITKGQEQFLTSIVGARFLGLVSDTSSGTRDVFAAGHLALNDSTHANIFAARLSDSLTVVWNTDIIPPGGLKAEGYVGPLAFANGRLIITGEVESDKTPQPSGGGYWHSGFVAALGVGGEILWTKTVTISQHSDHFFGETMSDGYLYAVGKSCAYVIASTRENFGYGWLMKMDPVTGNVVWNMHVGSDRYYSGFNTVVVRGDRAYCAGWTLDEKDDSGGNRYWFAALDITNPPSTLSRASVSRVDAADVSRTSFQAKPSHQ